MKTQHIISAVGAVLLASAAVIAADEKTSGKAEKPGWFKRNFGSLTLDDVATLVATPSEVCWRVRSRVRFKDDSFDQWASGKETWERGYGDCEDFGACVIELCKKKGFDAEMYVFSTTKGKDRFTGHVGVVGKWNDKMWLSSNGSWQEVKSLDEARESVAVTMRWSLKDTFVSPMRQKPVGISTASSGKQPVAKAATASSGKQPAKNNMSAATKAPAKQKAVTSYPQLAMNSGASSAGTGK